MFHNIYCNLIKSCGAVTSDWNLSEIVIITSLKINIPIATAFDRIETNRDSDIGNVEACIIW